MQDLPAFFLWDSESSSLTAIVPSDQWNLLDFGQAIIGTTSPTIGEFDNWEKVLADLTVSTDELPLENNPAEFQKINKMILMK